MIRTRFLSVAMLAVVLLAAACGGDEDSAEEPAEQASEVTTSDGDQPDSGATERADLDGDAAPTTAPPPLGERFQWCGEVQSVLDRQAQAQAQDDAAVAEHVAAWEAWNAATDELDKAEALPVLEAAGRASEDAWTALTAANKEAAWLLKPDYNPHPDTFAIALERARSEYRQHADPAVLELLEYAYSASASAPSEPEPQETATAADSQAAEPESEPRNLEDSLAAVAVIQSEIDELAWTAYEAVQEADEALASLYAAEDARSAIDAHKRMLDALQRADEGDRQLRDAGAYRTLRERVEVPYLVYAEAALAAGEITADEHEAALTAIQDAITAVAGSALSSGAETSEFRWLAQTAIEHTAHSFILAATDGMAAFQGSLSESCQP